MSGRLDLRSDSPDATQQVGAALARLLGPGDIVSLTGDLGAGKTTLVQGAARALGVTDPVASPTFVLVREYRGDLPIFHVDVYRLDRLQEVLDLGFEDLVDSPGLMFVEWGSAIEALLPDSYLEVELTVSDGDARGISVIGRGRAWAERWEGVTDALGTWRAA